MRILLEFGAGVLDMADWLQPLWDLFTPHGANQEHQDNRQIDQAVYASFGRQHTTAPRWVHFPASQEPSNVSTWEPTSSVGLNQQQINQVATDQTQAPDPRTQNNVAVAWDLQNMNVQPTSPTNQHTGGFIALIGLFFVGMVFVNMLRKK